MTRKDEWLKKYLTADKETRIEMSTKMKKSAGWNEYYPGYTADVTARSIKAEYAFPTLFKELTGQLLMLDSVNNYIYDTGDKRVNLLGRSDFRTYSNVLGRMINIEVKCQPRCHEFGQIAIKKENIKKAKNEHADYLFIVDDRGDVVGHRINDEIVGKQEFDFGNLSEIRQELVSKLVADEKIEENFEIY